MNRLIEFELVTELGRMDAPGRPLLFGTTEQFLRSFGVKSLEELPELNEMKLEEFKVEAEEEASLAAAFIILLLCICTARAVNAQACPN